MFKLVRLVIAVLVSFVAGVFFERGNQQDRCADLGGSWSRAGFCSAAGEGS